MDRSNLDTWHMTHALQLAAGGQGHVEPNPLVGCTITRGAEIIGLGWHRRFGGPHAEVEALALAGSRARGATMYVTLEPCCHQGKTPPCTQAVIDAGVARVVVALEDPFAEVAGRGSAELRSAGIAVEVGILADEARRQNAPYLKLLATGRPWVTAKWAMTLDGKIATATGDSQWISGEPSRTVAHQLRGRMDAILVGSRTARLDDPLLTARPPGARVATRIVADSKAILSSSSRLLNTANQVPVLIAAGPEAAADDVQRLQSAGCEVWVSPLDAPLERLAALLDELGRRRMTHLLVEGGGTMLGAMFDIGAVDEVHVFVAPKIVGGSAAAGPVAGGGIAAIADALMLIDTHVEQLGEDMHLSGRVARG